MRPAVLPLQPPATAAGSATLPPQQPPLHFFFFSCSRVQKQGAQGSSTLMPLNACAASNPVRLSPDTCRPTIMTAPAMHPLTRRTL